MKKYDFTQGSIFKSLLLISVPIIFANILQTAYQLIDTFWLGRLGASALASASLSFPIIYFVISLAGGLATAAAILTAQYKGGKKFEKINMATGQTLAAIMLVAIPISLFGISCSGLILRFMDVGGDIYANAVSYLRISFAGAIFMFIFMVFQSAMRGIGNVKTPMYIVLVTVILNFFLDPIFIFGFDSFSGYGVAGAAIATVITQTIAALTALYILFFGNKGIKIKMCDLKIKKLWIFKIFKLGIPAAIEQSVRAFAMVIMIGFIASLGTLTLAAYSIGGRILSFIIIPALGISIGTSILVGQNIGAERWGRAIKVAKISAWSSFLILTLIGAVLFVLADFVAWLFIPADISAAHESAMFIKIMAPMFGFVGIQMSLNGLYRGTGNTFLAMLLSLLGVWGLRLPLAYLLAFVLGWKEFGIWWAFPIAGIINAIISLTIFKFNLWRNTKNSQ